MRNPAATIPIAILLLTVTLNAQTQTSTTTPTQPPTAAPKPEKPMDWPNLQRYQSANAALPAPLPNEHRVVFFGDSITDGWHISTSFPGKPYINRGISGQTTPQMLVRFQQDVVSLKPAVVVILAGTNDIAGNTGPSTPEMTEDNFRSMTAIARQNNIKVVLASITPAGHYPWKPAIEPVPVIRELNQWLKQYCVQQGFVYLDYYTAMADDKGAMKPGLSSDGVHPTPAGYAVMAPLAEAAIAQALKQ
jgi:lysophospholipase L1-like esterase